MSDDDTDGTVVESIVGAHVKEGILENASGEANFVGCGVIVCVDSLRCHVPLVTIDGFVELACCLVLGSPDGHGLHVLVKGELRVDGKCGIVAPLVGITDLHIEGGEFLLGVLLGAVAHPLLCVDALCERNLKVLYQRHHSDLVLRREILLHVHLSNSLSEYTVDSIH